MKKILSVMFALFSATAMYAQSHGNHLMLGVGGSYPQGVETTLSYEHETDYHNAWEYFGIMYLKSLLSRLEIIGPEKARI